MKATAFCVACLAIGWVTLAAISSTNLGQRQQQLEEARGW